jgi:protein LSM14
LLKVDNAERAMHLQKVQSFGSEGRRGEGLEIPPNDNIIESVIFKIDHIQDFNIIQRPDTKAEEIKREVEVDPAIVKAPQQPKP